MPKKTILTAEEEHLIQLESIVVDKNASKDVRLQSFLQQVDNPYRFKHKKLKVRLSYSNSKKSLEDCLLHIGRGL